MMLLLYFIHLHLYISFERECLSRLSRRGVVVVHRDLPPFYSSYKFQTNSLHDLIQNKYSICKWKHTVVVDCDKQTKITIESTAMLVALSPRRSADLNSIFLTDERIGHYLC